MKTDSLSQSWREREEGGREGGREGRREGGREGREEAKREERKEGERNERCGRRGERGGKEHKNT